jgi:hypothetical protein
VNNSEEFVKKVVGSVPMAAEMYQRILSPSIPPSNGFELDRLRMKLPDWHHAAESARSLRGVDEGSRILLVGYLRWWFEYAIAMGYMLVGAGHELEIAYLPFRNWTDQVDAFTSKRQSIYMQDILRSADSSMAAHDLSKPSSYKIPDELTREIEEQSYIDVQYTLQREDVRIDLNKSHRDLYKLRLRRNMNSARQAYKLLLSSAYDAVVIPNGSILEFGAIYKTANQLGIPIVTFEFGEQRERLWLTQNGEVMRQDTSEMWRVRGGIPLTSHEEDTIRALFDARTHGNLWKNFKRQWQVGSSQGAQAALKALDLDPDKPIALLCTNVVGDSLALNRQIFTDGMADWLSTTARHLSETTDTQLIVRVHPGELLGVGHPSLRIIDEVLPELPDNVRVIPPESEINTYDLIELASVGLVYTTTVGLEMVMSGVPVIVAGQTHYRGKGFTYDPKTLGEYVHLLDRIPEPNKAPSVDEGQVDLAWRYAYRFFFEFPFVFPWHLIGFWDDIEARPLEYVLEESNLNAYERTVQALVGKPIDWER